MIRNVKALTQRELSAIFYSLIAYIIGVLFLVVTAVLFSWNTRSESVV